MFTSGVCYPYRTCRQSGWDRCRLGFSLPPSWLPWRLLQFPHLSMNLGNPQVIFTPCVFRSFLQPLPEPPLLPHSVLWYSTWNKAGPRATDLPVQLVEWLRASLSVSSARRVPHEASPNEYSCLVFAKWFLWLRWEPPRRARYNHCYICGLHNSWSTLEWFFQALVIGELQCECWKTAVVLNASDISVGGVELGMNVDGYVWEITAQVPMQMLWGIIGQRTCLSRCTISN